MNKTNLKTLGNRVTKFQKLDTFPTPKNVSRVCCISDEVTSLCPVTGQPDWYVVEINYEPRKLCVESKALKLFLQSFRNQGHFCEAFASIILRKLSEVLNPSFIMVTVTQKPRGGISIKATAQEHMPHPNGEF